MKEIIVKIHFIPLLILLIGLSGCVTTQYSVIPSEGENVTLISGTDGQGAASVGLASIVVMEPHSAFFTSGERPGFNVSVINAGQEQFQFGVSNMSVRYDDTELTVLDEETLVKEAKSKKAWSDFGTSLQFVAAALSVLSGNTSQMTAMAVGQELDKKYESARKLLEQSLTQYRETVLKSETVAPEGQHGGFFLVEKPRSLEDQGVFDITVNINDEAHHFRYETSRVGNK